MPQSHEDTKKSPSALTFVSLCLRGKKQITLIIFLLLSTLVISQHNRITTIEITNVQSAYVDRPGDLYVLQKDNTLKKFDIQGTLVREQILNSPTSFDPRDGARLFYYSQASQQFSFFSEETKQDFSIEQHYAIEPVLVCASGDHQVWILDAADWSLKRVNPSQSKVLSEALIDQSQFTKAPQFSFMREYQNFLFVLERESGILIFNSLGTQIKHIDVPEIEYINFLGEELYYKKNNRLIFYNLFDASVREIPLDPACKYTLLTDARMFLIFENRIDIFKNP